MTSDRLTLTVQGLPGIYENWLLLFEQLLSEDHFEDSIV